MNIKLIIPFCISILVLSYNQYITGTITNVQTGFVNSGGH